MHRGFPLLIVYSQLKIEAFPYVAVNPKNCRIQPNILILCLVIAVFYNDIHII